MNIKYKTITAAIFLISIALPVTVFHFIPIANGVNLKNNLSTKNNGGGFNIKSAKNICIIPYYRSAENLKVNAKFYKYMRLRVNDFYGKSEKYWWIFSEGNSENYKSFKILGDYYIPILKNPACYEQGEYFMKIDGKFLLLRKI